MGPENLCPLLFYYGMTYSERKMECQPRAEDSWVINTKMDWLLMADAYSIGYQTFLKPTTFGIFLAQNNTQFETIYL